MCYKHLNQASGLGNEIADFAGSMLAFKDNQKCLCQNQPLLKRTGIIFKNWEQDNEDNTVKKHESL